VLVITAIFSVQAGSALATTLFDEAGPAAGVFLRTVSAALILVAFWRPRVTGLTAQGRRTALAFGVTLAAMNLCFYESLDRLPLGIAVTLEFVGPLGVALLGSRSALDLLWAGLAAAGIVLLAGGVGSGASVDTLGAALALTAGFFWGAYILISARAGQLFPGGTGLAIAMAISAILVAPFGIAGGGGDLISLGVLATGAGVGLLSSVIPYSFELEALRSLPEGVFGVLMSLEPGAAALIGFLALGQGLAASETAAIVLVVIASAGALRSARGATPRDA